MDVSTVTPMKRYTVYVGRAYLRFSSGDGRSGPRIMPRRGLVAEVTAQPDAGGRPTDMSAASAVGAVGAYSAA